jgi:hypothetical protein
MDLEVQGMRR